jgi:hypothetical protein
MAPNLEHVKRAPYSSEEPRTASRECGRSSMLLRQNNIWMGAASGSQYGAMTVAAEILIAQLHSQSKLTTAWHENRKIRYENELLKAKEPAPDM